MKQCPYRIVVLVPKLTLNFSCGETFLRACQKVHRYEPVSQRKLTAVHNGVSLETLPVVTMFALVAFLVLLPIMLCTSAVRANNTMLLSVFFQLAFAACLIRKGVHKVYKSHIPIVYRDKSTDWMCLIAAQAHF